ncbi:MAG: triosephosphate isomerase [Chlorobi bacterium OLB7]|nr:MAG: triosephosphate isomerase [Chlorobi bacterium OLB7]
MNMDLEAGAPCDGVKMGTLGMDLTDTFRVVLCPPAVLLHDLSNRLSDCTIAIGGQNLHNKPSGAFTGELSGAMLRSVGCQYVIVGHSERRTMFAESDIEVCLKANAALDARLSPIICVGETITEREEGRVKEVLSRQVRKALEGIFDFGITNCVIAYEPVWAIGTGNTATPEQAQEAHRLIRDLLASIYNPEVAQEVSIIYGGSVTPQTRASCSHSPILMGR